MPLFMKWVTNHKYYGNPQLPMPFIASATRDFSFFLCLFVLVLNSSFHHLIIKAVVRLHDVVHYISSAYRLEVFLGACNFMVLDRTYF